MLMELIPSPSFVALPGLGHRWLSNGHCSLHLATGRQLAGVYYGTYLLPRVNRNCCNAQWYPDPMGVLLPLKAKLAE